MRIAIVGAGTAGASTAYTLRSLGFDGSISLWGAEGGLPYEKPPLSKQVLAQPEPPQPVSLLPDNFMTEEVDYRPETEIQAVEQAGSTLLLRGAGVDHTADKVVIATGGRPRLLPALAPSASIHYLRSWSDAMALREALAHPPGRLLIVGSGFIGVEVALRAATLGWKVTIAEKLPMAIPVIEPAPIRQALLGLLERHDIDVFHDSVTSSMKVSKHLDVTFASGRTETYDLVVVGIGIVPNSEPASPLRLQQHKRAILVNQRFQSTNPNVYAVGDVATRDVGGRLIRHEHWISAQRDGEAVARAVLQLSPPTELAPWVWSDLLEHRLEVLGHPGEGTREYIRRDEGGGLGSFHFRNQVLCGVTSWDLPEAVRFARRLWEAEVPFDPSELENPRVPLKRIFSSRHRLGSP